MLYFLTFATLMKWYLTVNLKLQPQKILTLDIVWEQHNQQVSFSKCHYRLE